MKYSNDIRMSNHYTNEHGVELYRWGDAFVPKCCLDCEHLDAEFGDLGSVLAGPYCERNIFMPRRKGTCKRFDPLMGFKRIPH